MTYTIIVRVIDTSDIGFTIVEKTVWHFANGGTWTDSEGIETLTMNGSGTSGALRFRGAPDGEEFLVLLGIHNYQRWCDIVTDLGLGETAMKIQPTYYKEGGRGDMLWKQLPAISKKNSMGRQIEVKYVAQESAVYRVNVTIS